MSTPQRNPDGLASTKGSARPIVAYVATVAVATWLLAAVGEVTNGDGPPGGPTRALTSVLQPGLAVLVALLAVLLVPAMVLTIELVRRFDVRSRAIRSALGAAIWAGWGLFVALSLALLSRIVLLAEILGPDLLVLAAAGAVFPLLALRAQVSPAGRPLTLAALAVTALVVVGSVVLSGQWGAAA